MASLLIVDDDHDGRLALCQFLSRKGYQVTGVPSGRAAQASFLGRIPELVILDLLMPQMDGGDLLRVIRSDMGLHSLPVIVLTGFPDCPALDRARDLNVNAVLLKGSATLEDIRRTVEAELTRKPEERPARRAASADFAGRGVVEHGRSNEGVPSSSSFEKVVDPSPNHSPPTDSANPDPSR